MGWAGRERWTAALVAGAATLCWADGAAGACAAAGDQAVAVAAVEARLELRLGDGRRVRLVGLDPALGTPDEPDRDERTRTAFAALVAGRVTTVTILARDPDRWGRLPAFGFVAGEAQPGGLAAAAVAAGLGRYLPEPAARDCRQAFIAAEEAARAVKLGLWADPYYAVLAIDDRSGFTERSGTLVTAEGRLASVTVSPYRTKLAFRNDAPGSRGGQLLSATIAPRIVKLFEAQGVRVQSLVGRTLRLRGLLDLRFGPQIDLAGPDSLDVLDAPAAGGTDAQPK